MSEQVIRHRGGGRDENGELIGTTDSTLTAIAVAPSSSSGLSGGSNRIERGRTGEDLAWTVYFNPGTDVVDDDELTVRGRRFRIIVNDWHLSGRGGLEVLCTRGQG